MPRLLNVRIVRRLVLRAGGLIALSGCATARPAPVSARLVTPAQWSSVVDCVVLAARASEYYAEADSTGITVTPGQTPLAQQRATSRAGVVGTLRLTPVRVAGGLRITSDAFHWDAPASGRAGTAPASAARAMARQLDAQCLTAYPRVSAE